LPKAWFSASFGSLNDLRKREPSQWRLSRCEFRGQQSRMPVGRADALLPEDAPLEPMPVFAPAEPLVVPLLMPPELPVPLEPVLLALPAVPLPVVPLEPPVPVELPLVPLALPVVPDTFDDVRI
jgi:hypothetical protein